MRRTRRLTGMRAWRTSTRSSTSVVITDFLMPGLTGLDVAEAITGARSHDADRDDRGHAEPDVQTAAVQAGLRFLRKPVTLAQFGAAIAEVLEPAGAAR